MKGITVEKAGAEYKLVDDIEKPSPGKNQILVKSLVTGINPVEGYMQGAGTLVTAWPIVLGCDASGVVVEVGDDVTKFKKGDGVYGCTRLGIPGYATFQDYFLMDETVTFKKPGNITTEQAATIGVGLLTAALSLEGGLKIDFQNSAEDKGGAWVIVLGAAGSVGQFAVQIAKLNGYKVLASCSPGNVEFLKGLGADATFNYKEPLDKQLEAIDEITAGKSIGVFDASGMATETGMKALDKDRVPYEGTKYFATTNDWMPIEPKEGVQIFMVALGEIGREGEQYQAVNKTIREIIPVLERWVESGAVKPMTYDLVEGVGLDVVLTGLKVFDSRKSNDKKIIVRIAQE